MFDICLCTIFIHTPCLCLCRGSTHMFMNDLQRTNLYLKDTKGQSSPWILSAQGPGTSQLTLPPPNNHTYCIFGGGLKSVFFSILTPTYLGLHPVKPRLIWIRYINITLSAMWMNAAFKLRSGVWVSFCTSQGKLRVFFGVAIWGWQDWWIFSCSEADLYMFRGFSGMAIYVLFIKVFKQVVGKKWETELGYQRSNMKNSGSQWAIPPGFLVASGILLTGKCLETMFPL